MYKTKQKEAVLKFFTDNPDKQFTIAEIVSLMEKEDDAPGQSTLYRIIANLLSEGLLKRFVKENSRHFTYQMVDRDECRSHLHMKCEKCGKLVHLSHSFSEGMVNSILSSNGFSIDEQKTVFYGVCSDCR